MAYKIVWSIEATIAFNDIVKYLAENFFDKEIKSFIQTVNRRLLVMQQFPKISPVISIYSRRRKAVIHQRTLIFYRVDEKRKEIILLSFWNIRRNMP